MHAAGAVSGCLLLVDLGTDSSVLQILGDFGILAMSGDQRWRAA
jgi:hypothetical protein